jgi:hypothetical protein
MFFSSETWNLIDFPKLSWVCLTFLMIDWLTLRKTGDVMLSQLKQLLTRRGRLDAFIL